jgi:glycosidase
MAIPATKATLKTYCLRSLGFGVIDINVSDDQVDDRIDEALQYFAEYHYDGIERVYLKHQVSQSDIDRANTNYTTSATDTVDSTVTATWFDGAGYIPTPEAVVAVVNVFPFSGGTSGSLFDIRYQLRLNDLYDFSSTSIMEYQMTLQHLDFLEHILVGEVPIRFSQHQQRLYLDMDWNNDLSVGEFIIIECYRKLDPTQFTDIFNDMYLKRYTTALIKRQWGSNLSKFSGVEMLGGVTMNGGDIYSQAIEEITKLEDQIQLHFELPINYMIG